VRTRWWPQLAPRRPDAAWPCTSATGVREGWRGKRKMMAWSAWIEEGLSSGDTARPSSAMVAMAAAAQERGRERAKARASVEVSEERLRAAQVLQIELGMGRGAEAHGRGGGARRPCMVTTSTFGQTRGARQRRQGGTRFGLAMGQISH
jgi:hypothetical protein